MVYETYAVGSVFAGIGVMIVLLVLSYLFYQFARILKGATDLDSKYMLIEELALDKLASSKGINLTKEIAKRDILKGEMSKHNFRKQLKQEAYESLFGKVKEEA